MAEFRYGCPHCGTERASFGVLMQRAQRQRVFTLLCTCAVCGDDVLFWVYRDATAGPWDPEYDRLGEFSVIKTAPESVAITAPPNTPDKVARLYIQAVQAARAGLFDAAAPTFRRALEAAAKHLTPDKPKLHLMQRIDQLPPEKGITPAMVQWAHAVRLIGNDGAHEEDPVTPEDAADIQAFTELFLTYAFTLPARLEAQKLRRGRG